MEPRPPFNVSLESRRIWGFAAGAPAAIGGAGVEFFGEPSMRRSV